MVPQKLIPVCSKQARKVVLSVGIVYQAHKLKMFLRILYYALTVQYNFVPQVHVYIVFSVKVSILNITVLLLSNKR